MGKTLIPKFKKPAGCTGCPLLETGEGFVPDEVVPSPDIVIMAEAPGGTEVESGKPLVGKAGFVLKEWIMKAVPEIQIAYEKKKVSLCNVLKCKPPEHNGRPYPTGDTRVKAEEHCKQYLKLGEPKLIILCGEVPQRYFFKDELEAEDATDRALGHEAKGVMGRVGRVYTKAGVRYVFAPHPAFVLRQPALVTHAQEAFRIAAGKDKVIEPEIVNWTVAVIENAKSLQQVS